MTEQFHSGLGYSAMNTCRSALSAIGIVIDGMPAGTHPLIVRFLKGVFNLRPTRPRYVDTWDVSGVLKYLQKLSPVKLLSMKELTLKLVMLLALVLASRAQSLHLLDISEMIKSRDGYTLQYAGLLKQSRPGRPNPSAVLKSYPPDRRLCVIFVLREYLKRTKYVRRDNTRLLLSYIKPYAPVSRDTISRWLRCVMSKAGIDIKHFAPHSVRGAASSKAARCFVPVEAIMKVAGWSSVKTFATFYNKPVNDQCQFQRAVLQT